MFYLKDIAAVTFPLIYIINIVSAGFIIFSQRKNPASTWCWLMVCTFLPPAGFLLYLIFGFEGRKYAVFREKEKSDEKLYSDYYAGEPSVICSQLSYIRSRKKAEIVCGEFSSLAILNIICADAPIIWLTDLKIYSRGIDMFSSLFKDIAEAESCIFLEYYIIRHDILGEALKSLLIKKAGEGVEIYVLYDKIGNIFNSRDFLRFEKNSNIHCTYFVSPKLIQLNYRCHRKICVIDYKKAYLGGFNIGTEYMGMSEKFGPWRDCHISFKGGGVADLALRFIADFNFSGGGMIKTEKITYPKMKEGAVPVQIVSGGPDCRCDNILNGFFRLISEAKKSVYIQTPYFVPDDSILEALKTAALSGADVRIMIPSAPDHPFVYWASLSYLGELIETGVKCYGYNGGFLHSKLIICDGFAVSVGTANLDMRSLKLNFETTAIIYDSKAAGKFTEIFKRDLAKSSEITPEIYTKRPLSSKIKESLSRLISPML